MCVPDVVKNLKVKMFNLVSGNNETRRIEWYETCKCKCRFNISVFNNKQLWNDYKCRCECNKLIDKGVCDKGFISTERSSAEECTENIEETRLVEINSIECYSVKTNAHCTLSYS